MTKLFGIPVDVLMWVFAAITLLAILWSIVVIVRQPILFRLSMRNIHRRVGRAMLIVVGLMLATTIISAAFTTGDTIAKTIRTEVIISLGNVDEIISAQEEGDIEVTGEAAQLAYMDEAVFDDVRQAAADDTNIDGVMPLLWEGTGVQSLTTRRTEPRVIIFAPDPAFMDGFGTMKDTGGTTVTMDDLSETEVYLNAQAAEDFDAEAGHELAVYGPSGPETFTVKAIVSYDGAGAISTQAGLMMRLSAAQALFNKEGQIRHIAISNRGGAESGASLTEEVTEAIQPTVESLGLSIEPTKQEDLAEADETGDAISSFFVIFGSFSIAAGIMLIFLIFVMLAGERQPEMGISRAIGAERRNIIEMFALEGLAYDLVAAAVGAVLGVAVAWVMVGIIGAAFAEFGLELRRTAEPESIIAAYVMGVVLTFIVVTISAWRVSALNIVAAIRNQPEPPKPAGRASLVWGAICLLAGIGMIYLGIAAEQVTPFSLGVSLTILSAIPFLRWLGVPDRPAFSVPALILLIYWLLPFDTFDSILPEMSVDFNWFIAGGLIMVTAATWLIVYNSDALVQPFMVVLGRVPALVPTLRTAISYPLTNRFRTGMTLAMFTLVVFTLVVGAVTTNAFMEASDSDELYNGGFEIRAETVRVNPLPDARTAILTSSTLDPTDFEVIANQSLVAAEVQQVGTDKEFAAYPVRGLDDAFLETVTYRFANIATGYEAPEEVWRALKESPGLAVMDALPVPQRDNMSVGAPMTDFQVEGFWLDDDGFDPFEVVARDPVTGASTTLTVIAILTDVIQPSMIGLSTSQSVIDEAFPQQGQPTAHYLRLSPGGSAPEIADALEGEFLANGMEAVVLSEELDDFVAVSETFNYIVEGFLGLGLIVGVAALGVISARAVVERRHEIGVMRAIGFERERVQLSFLIESCMVALVGIVVGTVLALAISFNIIRDTQSQPAWEHLEFAVPWLALGVIFAVVLVASAITAYVPARQASKVYPAEALRYE